MKKYLHILLPVAVFVSVFVVCELRLRWIFISMENNGLFLMTPDYFTDVFSRPFPISHIVGSSFVQFFRFPCVGAALAALAVTALYVVLTLIFRKHSKVANICCIAAVSVLILGISIDGKITRAERWAKIEYATRQHDWKTVLATATPERAAADREMTPFALLAHSALGTLEEHLFDYPINGPEDLDMEGVATRRGYFFSSILYECLCCPNEALHYTFQSACCLPAGNSFLTLRQQIRYYLEIGDYDLVRKYCAILMTSPANRGLAKAVLASIPADESYASWYKPKSDDSAVVTHNPIFNLVIIDGAGYHTQMALDRFQAYTRIQQMTSGQ